MNKLKELRLATNKTLNAVSYEIGISATSLFQYENEQRKPNPQMLKKLAEYYGTSIDYILSGDNSNFFSNNTINSNNTTTIGCVTDEMEKQLILIFRKMDFNDKLSLFNYLKKYE